MCEDHRREHPEDILHHERYRMMKIQRLLRSDVEARAVSVLSVDESAGLKHQNKIHQEYSSYPLNRQT